MKDPKNRKPETRPVEPRAITCSTCCGGPSVAETDAEAAATLSTWCGPEPCASCPRTRWPRSDALRVRTRTRGRVADSTPSADPATDLAR
jgi:hypothetical protein